MPIYATPSTYTLMYMNPGEMGILLEEAELGIYG
jgi:hypothetical protein